MVAPGADPNAIALEIETGNSKLEKPNWKLEKRNWKSENGGKRAISRQWSVAANEGRRTTDAVNPKSQIQNRKSVDGRYVLLADNRVGFEVGAYDKTLPLIIDPVLTYGTYLGGTNEDRAYAVAADSSGNAYVAGVSYSFRFSDHARRVRPRPRAATGLRGGGYRQHGRHRRGPRPGQRRTIAVARLMAAVAAVSQRRLCWSAAL